LQKKISVQFGLKQLASFASLTLVLTMSHNRCHFLS